MENLDPSYQFLADQFQDPFEKKRKGVLLAIDSIKIPGVSLKCTGSMLELLHLTCNAGRAATLEELCII